MLIPTGFDPITLNHWLWFKYKCHECSPTEFQYLFEGIIQRARPEFIKIRPYGNIGDRKCDGLLYAEGKSTVFQVYSPDEFKQAELIEKIKDDLEGAWQHWQNSLEEWIFVYNARRGLPPDIPGIIEGRRESYPTLKLGYLSNDKLWEMTRELSLQQRCEILGAPTGYEHLFFSSAKETDDVKERLKTDSFVLVQDLMSPISLQAVSEAMAPARPFGAPFFIRPVFNELPWTEAAEQQKIIVDEIIEKSRDLIPRFSVFSFAPIPLAIHLGFLLSDRVEVQYFQFDRENKSWSWRAAEEAEIDDNIQVAGLPVEETNEPIEVSIAVSLSAKISKLDIAEAAPDSKLTVDVFVDNPDVMWLQSPRQLSKLARVFRNTLSKIGSMAPRCSRIHLFYSGPTGGSIVLGQQINPRMNPPVELYQYSQHTTPRNTPAITLTESIS